MNSKIRPIREGPPQHYSLSTVSGGNNGSDLDARLRENEIKLTRIEERVDGIKENMATKNDITNLKGWILGGVISTALVAMGFAAIVMKAFF